MPERIKALSIPADMLCKCESKLEVQALIRLIREPAIPAFRQQYVYDELRPRRRADFCWPEQGLIVQIDGGNWGRKGARKCRVCGHMPVGRHNFGKGFSADRISDAEAQLAGFSIFRFTRELITDGTMIKLLKQYFGGRDDYI